jgi:hypothetical protein
MMESFIPLSRLQAGTRPDSWPVSRDTHGAARLDWAGFRSGLAAVRALVAERPEKRWIIHTQDTVLFLQAVLAVLQAGREACIPGNLLPGTVAAIRGPGDGVLCDEDFPGALDLRRLAAETTAGESVAACGEFPPIDPKAALLHLFTSGSTGQPKQVTKRLEQVEAELANLHGQWGAALAGRAVHATVSHQHFYGMLFQAFLPLCAGLAVGAERLAYPEAFLALAGGGACALVGSPAFYKRLSETVPAEPAFARPPVLFSSGGVLDPAVASHTADLAGAGINEIYGSTETGGIAWRLSPPAAAWRLFSPHFSH